MLQRLALVVSCFEGQVGHDCSAKAVRRLLVDGRGWLQDGRLSKCEFNENCVWVVVSASPSTNDDGWGCLPAMFDGFEDGSWLSHSCSFSHKTVRALSNDSQAYN